LPPIDVPDFTISGVLPPFLGTTPVIPAAMSPYPTSLVQIAGKICGTDQRKAILRGLLAYRQRLAGIGLQLGVQWLSGSFLEDIETLESRDPRDVDVVTFFHRPAGATADADWFAFINANLALFEPAQVKAAFQCDSYFVDMNLPPIFIVSQTRYWYGLFSHNRGGLWKGMLQIPLHLTADDAAALVALGP
jgi:hypothetical protein